MQVQISCVITGQQNIKRWCAMLAQLFARNLVAMTGSTANYGIASMHAFNDASELEIIIFLHQRG